MTPKTQSEVARELWEKIQKEAVYPEEMQHAFIAGSLSALQRVQNECYVKGDA